MSRNQSTQTEIFINEKVIAKFWFQWRLVKAFLVGICWLVAWWLGGRKYLNHQSTKTQRSTNLYLNDKFSILLTKRHCF
jgi:hypothetical protein